MAASRAVSWDGNCLILRPQFENRKRKPGSAWPEASERCRERERPRCMEAPGGVCSSSEGSPLRGNSIGDNLRDLGCGRDPHAGPYPHAGRDQGAHSRRATSHGHSPDDLHSGRGHSIARRSRVVPQSRAETPIDPEPSSRWRSSRRSRSIPVQGRAEHTPSRKPPVCRFLHKSPPARALLHLSPPLRLPIQKREVYAFLVLHCRRLSTP
jgi:hypothetical protein